MDTILFIIFAVVAIVLRFQSGAAEASHFERFIAHWRHGSLAVLYLLLGAEFIAMAQMIVYGGAVMVLFIFVIMLLNAGSEKSEQQIVVCTNCWLATAVGLRRLYLHS